MPTAAKFRIDVAIHDLLMNSKGGVHLNSLAHCYNDPPGQQMALVKRHQE